MDGAECRRAEPRKRALIFLKPATSMLTLSAVLYNDVLPIYKKHKLSVENILTDNGREFCGTEQHPYDLYLELIDIKYRRTKVSHLQANGFVERFNWTMLDEFFRVEMHEKVYLSLELLQSNFDQWLNLYNEQRPYLGYRNHG
ncbi:transposase [bacterium]|nr:transposase [bacterium]